VVIQRAGPLGYIVEEATRAGARIIPASSEDYGDAVARLKTLITEGRLAHTDDPRLNAAVDAAVGMRRGDREVWARRYVTADISPIVAASFAVWRAATPKARPMVVGL
jgi:phage terminase large subunit-like protein